MKKLFAVLLSMILLVGCFAGCASQASDSDLEFVQNKGKLIVGITDYAPMDYKDDNGEWIGFDADLARLFAKELGVEIEFFVIADWSKKVFELDSKNIDVIWNGMTINDELKATTNCSKPYVLNAQVIITKADIAANYTTADSIKELTIAVENGSTGEDVLKDLGITDYVAVDTQSKAIMEVAAGTSEACIVDIKIAIYRLIDCIAFGYCDSGKSRTHSKSIIANTGHTIGNDNRSEVGAKEERTTANTGHTIRNDHRGEAGATLERTLANAGHALGNDHRGEAVAKSERTFANLFHKFTFIYGRNDNICIFASANT